NGEFKFYVKLAEKLVDLREYALKKSTGNYVYFIDAGDMISDEKLVDLYEKLTTQKADIVVDDIMKLKDGYFRFNSEDKTAVRQVVFNNYLLFLRRFPTFRKLAGILIKKSLFEQVDASVLSAPSQELFRSEKLTTQKADIVVDDIMKLKDGYFRFNSEDKTAVRQVVFNNYLLFLRRFPTFRKLAGILIKKSLFEQVDASVLSAPSQELF